MRPFSSSDSFSPPVADSSSPERIAVIPAGVDTLVAYLQWQLLPNQDRTAEWFDWQTYPLTEFFGGMELCRDKLGPGRHKFVDVGSGIGTKLFLADSLGFEPTGIERREDYIEVSRRLYPEYKVHHANALDFTAYEQFDVIYTYRLARNEQLQEQVHNHILQNMRDEAILFASDTPATLDKIPT